MPGDVFAISHDAKCMIRQIDPEVEQNGLCSARYRQMEGTAVKRILLLINGHAPPFSQFAAMFSGIVQGASQFTLEVADDRNVLCDPSDYDAVALYISSGELTRDQELGITGYVRNGGGLLAVHTANAGLAQYADYIEMIGTEFIGHDPLGDFEVEVDPAFDAVLPRLRPSFRIEDECYKMDIKTEAPLRWFQHGIWKLERKPLGYVRDYGRGRVFYTALGHDNRAFAHPDFQDQLIKGLRYVCGMSEGSPVRIGLVGYGPLFGMGKHHSDQIAATSGFELGAICDRDPARLEAAREEQGEHVPVFSDAGEMAGSGCIDLAIVIVPHAYHASVAKPLLDAGLHVITEKPFTVHVSEADELIALARARGVMISVYHNRHWDPDILSMKEIIDRGDIGEVYAIESALVGYGLPGQAWRSDKAISGGAMYDFGAHNFEKILQLVPQYDGQGNRINKRATLYGNYMKRVWHSSTNEDYCRAYARFDSGLEAQFITSSIHASPRPMWIVLGTAGSIVMEGGDGAGTVTMASADGRHRVVEVKPYARGSSWHSYYKNVADHLLAGLPLAITGEWAKGPIQLIEGCETASKENRLVEVEFDF